MNLVELVGRLAKDPEITYTQSDEPKCVAKFTLCVGYGDDVDFIRCVTFGKRAEFCEKYLFKGMKIAASGRIKTGSYENRDGVKIYTTDVILNDIEFCEKKNSGEAGRSESHGSGNDDFYGSDAELQGLPFN